MPPADRQPHAPEPDQEPRHPPEQEDAMLYCPVCNQRLVQRKCKLICERCGYYMSCADYY
jgi:hypothetical protein